MKVYVLGTIHGMHGLEKYGYSYADLARQVRDMAPDLVCVEMAPEARGGPREAMFPWEVAVVEDAAAAVGAEVEPVDWRPEFAMLEVDAMLDELDPGEKRAIDALYDDFMPLVEGAGARSFEFWHAPETQEKVQGIHERMIALGTEVAAGFWDTRNQVIAKRCLRKRARMVAAGKEVERVVFAFGAEHKYAIEGYLRKLYGIDAQPVERRAPPSGDPVSAEVLERWEAARAGLAGLLDRGELPAPLAAQFRVDHVRKLAELISREGRPR